MQHQSGESPDIRLRSFSFFPDKLCAGSPGGVTGFEDDDFFFLLPYESPGRLVRTVALFFIQVMRENISALC